MQAIILSIGDELILGQTVDTNTAWLASQLAAVGITPIRHLTVSDSQEQIESAIRDSIPGCDILLISGGLGPTEDDLTRQALSNVLNQPLELIPAALENVERFFKALNREMPERNRIQAMLPRGTSMIENTNGTAPGIHADLSSPPLRASVPQSLRASLTKIFIMPGVPKEMKTMFTRSVLPRLGQQGGAIILSKTLHTFGLGESAVAEKIPHLMRRGQNPSVGTTVSNGFVSLRLNAYFNDPQTAQTELAKTEQQCREALGHLIWGENDQTLAKVVADLFIGSSPRAAGKSIATAESCTGGLLAKFLTDVPGSSAFYERGWITYSNEAKVNSLGVSQDLLNQHGAVSQPVAQAMAMEAYLHSGADYALAITGIAGPTGGTPEKPVGTVCICLYAGGLDTTVQTRTFTFPGDREMIRDRSAKMALTMLRYHLLNQPLPF